MLTQHLWGGGGFSLSIGCMCECDPCVDTSQAQAATIEYQTIEFFSGLESLLSPNMPTGYSSDLQLVLLKYHKLWIFH